MKKNIQDLIRHIREAINTIYAWHEADAMAMLVAEHVLHLNRLQLSTERNQPVEAGAWVEADRIIARLQQHEPLQYVLGCAHFYGLELEVSPAVLIPRPETEELVDLIVRENKARAGGHILDVCTGSGCIAIALSAHLAPEKVYGLDISEPALVLARNNALKYDQDITWLRQDILNEAIALPPQSLDILVSNPPYVLEQEKSSMRRNVLDFEPHLALFVPDSNALLFYTRIGRLAWDLLKPEGKLYFEINEQQAGPLQAALQEIGFDQVAVKQDLFGKDRFLRAGRAVPE